MPARQPAGKRARRELQELAARCDELGGFLGPARHACALAWDGSSEPRVRAACGDVQGVFDVPAAELVDQSVAGFFLGGERAARDLAEACQLAPLAETRSLVRRGRPFRAELLLSKGAGGGAVALIRDLSAVVENTETAQRTEDLARFASLVAHEVRNPLSAVKIALQTLERHGALASNDLRRASIALREVLNIELLLTEVLEFARPPSLSLVPGDPRGPVQEAAASVEAEWETRKVRFEVRVPERAALVPIDPVRIRTAVRILCRHAAVATEEVGGGTVEVEVQEVPGGWTLRVSDAGRTLSPELRERAFVPFTPQRARGSGLGLAVVARIAQEHRGEARLEDRPGGGNTILVRFAE